MNASLALYTRYPLSSVIAYNGLTVLHFLLGGAGLVLGYPSWPGYLSASLYLVFAFTEMYVLMPLNVCPNCPYFTLRDSRCVAGLNLVSRRLASRGHVKDFPKRARGPFCANNLYLAALVMPVIGTMPGVVVSFSYALLGILLALVGLLLFRFFVLFPRVACGHCRARNICPNAQAMGLSKTADTPSWTIARWR